MARWGENEFLLHGKENADLSRLSGVGAVLYGHNAYDIDAIIGPVVSARIDEKARRGEAVIAFDDDDTGNKALAKVKSGSLRGVSFGYRIHEAVQVQENEKWIEPKTKREFNGPAIVATKWEAFEISLTPVPADSTVGIGRAARSLDGIRIKNANEKKETDMEKDEIKKMIGEAVEGLRASLPRAEDILAQVTAAVADQGKPQLRVSPEVLLEITGRAAAVGLETKCQVIDLALAGKTEAELLRHIGDAAIARRDARDNGDGPLPNARGTETPALPKLSEVDDDLLARSLKHPIEAAY